MSQKKDDRRIYLLSEEEPMKAVLKLGVPLVAGMFIMVLYNLVDTFFIGLLHDDYQLAAVNLAYPILMITIALSNVTGTGASSYIARSLGANNHSEAERTLSASVTLTLLHSLFVTCFGILFLNALVTLLGAKDLTFAWTKDYAEILLLGTVFTMGNYTFGQLLRAEGSVRFSLTGMILGTIVNIILDPIFIFAFHMNVKGAAIATILGNAAGMLCSTYYYLSRNTILQPDRSAFLPSGAILKEIYSVGIPASLETLLTSMAFIINNNLAVSYGELTVAATGVAQKIMTLGSYIYQGFASGIQPIMGYNYGAKNYRRMIRVLKAGLTAVTVSELFIMGIYGIFAPQLISIFTDHPEVIATGSKVLRAMMLILPFAGAVSMSRMSFQAMGKPGYAFGITVVRQILLYIPLLFLLNHLFGFTGLIHAQPVTEVIMMAVSISLLLHTIKREAKGM